MGEGGRERKERAMAQADEKDGAARPDGTVEVAGPTRRFRKCLRLRFGQSAPLFMK